MRKITEIIVHCSATPENKPFTVSDIDRWHRQRGFNSIGYHYVIYLDGSVHPGRPLSEVGAHCKGHNANSIGICYIGGLAADGTTAKDTRTPEQKQALRQLLLSLRETYPNATIHGHNELTCRRTQYEPKFNSTKCPHHCANCIYTSKACPSFNATKEYEQI